MNSWKATTPLSVLLVAASHAAGSPVGTAFTYQGQLKSGGSPANGSFNMVFKLFDASAAGNQVGPTLTFDGAGGNPAPVSVTNGLFTVQLDFTVSPYTANQARWIEIAVNGTTLSPQQPLTPAPFALNTRGLNVDASGKVGLGTTSPTTTLHVKGPDEQIRIEGAGVGAPNYAYAAFLDSTGTRIGYVGDASPDATSVFLASDNGDVILGTTVNRALNVKPNGNVGIGTTTPTVKLHVKSDGEALRVQGSGIGAANNAWVGFSDGNGTPTGYVGDADPGNGNMYLTSYTGDVFLGTAAGYILDVKDNGNVGIGTSTPTAKLDVNGTTRTSVLEITGADVAEKFPVSDKVEPGAVVEIDAEHPGQLRLCREAYSHRVAGVVSGAGDIPTGAILGNLAGNEKAPAIALSGRVWVHSDASNGAIEPGDTLTTSDRPGHAAKVIDHRRAEGAVIGKAMTSLSAGQTGLVLVLVQPR